MRISKLNSADTVLSSEDEPELIERLKDYGYSEDEITNAMDESQNALDMNGIIDIIKRNRESPDSNLQSISFVDPVQFKLSASTCR